MNYSFFSLSALTAIVLLHHQDRD